MTFTEQKVQLKNSSILRTMNVYHADAREVGAKGTVKFNGKTLIVQFDGEKWNHISGRV